MTIETIVWILAAFVVGFAIEQLFFMRKVLKKLDRFEDSIKGSKEQEHDDSVALMEQLKGFLVELPTMVGSQVSKIVPSDFSLSKLKESIQLSTEEYKRKLESLDSTVAGIHATIYNNSAEMKKCMTGIDENTRKLYGDLIAAVEKNDVPKLADVVRAAKAFVENYDAVHDAAMLTGTSGCSTSCGPTSYGEEDPAAKFYVEETSPKKKKSKSKSSFSSDGTPIYSSPTPIYSSPFSDGKYWHI